MLININSPSIVNDQTILHFGMVFWQEKEKEMKRTTSFKRLNERKLGLAHSIAMKNKNKKIKGKRSSMMPKN